MFLEYDAWNMHASELQKFHISIDCTFFRSIVMIIMYSKSFENSYLDLIPVLLENFTWIWCNLLCFLLIECMQYSLFGSILTFGAMIGAITSGPIADFVGRKGVIISGKWWWFFFVINFQIFNYFIWFWNIYMQAMRVSSAFCIAGWLVIYFSEVLTTKLVWFYFELNVLYGLT
jgi:hypothetical protein